MISDFLSFWGFTAPDAAREMARERARAQHQARQARRELQYQKEVLLGAQHQLAYAEARLAAAQARCRELGV